MANKLPLVFSGGTPVELQSGDILVNPATQSYVTTSGLGTDDRLTRADGTGAVIQSGPIGCTDAGVVTGITAINGGIVFNEPGDDADFRIEGDTATNLFFVDASLNEVNIGTTIVGAIARFLPSVGTVINEGGASDLYFRAEGDTHPFLFYVDPSSDSVKIGDSNGGIAIFSESGVVLNDSGDDRDFRVEGDTLTHLIFADASAATENIALVASAAPNWQSMDRGLYIANCTAAPTAAPTSGVFLYAQSGSLLARAEGNPATRLAPELPPPKVEFFGADGTWFRPAGAAKVRAYAVGGGGGGGSGRKGAGASIRGGGGGGGGGGHSFVELSASTLDSEEPVTVGAAGAGGAFQETNSTNGNAGSAGTASEFGSYVSAGGGGGGGGGTDSAGGAGGSGGSGNTQNGGAGGNGGGASLGSSGGGISGKKVAGAGGGGGWGVNSMGDIKVGGFGGESGGRGGSWGFLVQSGGDGVGGQAGSFITDPSFGVALSGGGGGGGGAGAPDAGSGSNVSNGGLGGLFGGGGGGGAGGTNTVTNNFNGGQAGGQGYVLVITYFSDAQAA